jgi:3,4-dihydroxy 2-butanone 4-phosphate synthase/GTP cyclohydrolase II
VEHRGGACGDRRRGARRRRASASPESAQELRRRALAVEAPSTTKVDLRNYGIGAQILRDLNVGKMRLLAKPRKMPSMAGFDLEVTGYVEQPAIASAS